MDEVRANKPFGVPWTRWLAGGAAGLQSDAPRRKPTIEGRKVTNRSGGRGIWPGGASAGLDLASRGECGVVIMDFLAPRAWIIYQALAGYRGRTHAARSAADPSAQMPMPSPSNSPSDSSAKGTNAGQT